MHAALILALLAGETLRPGIAVKDEAVAKGQATTVNCTGAGVTCSVGVGGVWTLDASGGAGGGAPTTVPYWTGAADATLSAEHNLGALATGLVLNTAGTPSAYGGATCTAPNFIRVLSASGAATCAAPTLRLDQLTNPTGDTAFTYPTGTKMLWTFTGSTDEAFTIHGDGAFVGTGDLVHIHKSGTGSSAGADALHVEVDADLNMTGLRITMANGTRTALSTNALVTAAGFSGPLTGSVTGTASALAADGANCSAGQAPLGVDASGAVQGCFTPAGTYTLPAATSTVLGGVKGTGSALVCSGTDKATGFDADGTLQCAADQTGASSGPAGYKVTGSNITNSTTTPTNITGLAWSVAASTEYGFSCTIVHQGTATGGPRFNLNGPASPTNVTIRWQRATSATADTSSTNTAFSAAAQTAAITSGGNTTVLVSKVNGHIINGLNAGTAQFMLTSSTAGQTVTVYRGSGCTVF